MRLFRLTFLIFTMVILTTVLILAIQRRNHSAAMWIAFVRADPPDNYAVSGNVVRILPNGKNLQSLTTLVKWYDTYLTWSPDGSQIAYSTDECEGGCFQIYTINMQTLPNQTLIALQTPYHSRQWLPTWSFDSEWLFYWSSYPTSHSYIKSQPNGSQNATIATDIYNIAVSPDNTMLAVAEMSSGAYNLTFSVQSLDTRHSSIVFHGFSDVSDLAWSPNSQNVAFSTQEEFNRTLYRINIDTGTIQELAIHHEIESPLAWSPDSQWIALSATDDPDKRDYNIYRVNVDGGVEQELTNTDGSNHFPQYSPDGRWISYVSDTGYSSEIFGIDSDIVLIRPDGSDRHIISNTTNVVETPVWSPLIDLPFHPLRLILPTAILLAIFIVLPHRLNRNFHPKSTY